MSTNDNPQMNSLFSEEELQKTDPLMMQADKLEPVICLGKTFESDDARRKYFRDELRKKLPELKQIEGFPIGEDEDIIKLSDPPYYTACPNPWLNDFIAEWEEEKKQLTEEGKRSDDFEVKEPYAADVSEGKNNPIYNAHSYHTKVPHPAIMRYILHYTQPGDIIFDGFCGTGMTTVAANMCNSSVAVGELNQANTSVGTRHSICSDLSPIASLIAAGYNTKFNSKQFEYKANEILDKVEKELGWMYETEVDGEKYNITSTVWSTELICPHCGNKETVWNLAVDEKDKRIRNTYICPNCSATKTKREMSIAMETRFDTLINNTINIATSVPVRISYRLNDSQSIKTKQVEIYDIDLLRKIDDYNISIEKVATQRMPMGDESRRNDKFGITHTHQFYTKRSFIILSRIYDFVKENPFLLAWFTSCLTSTTKMNRFRFSGTGINSGTLYIPSLSLEFTPFETLRRKISAFVSTYYEGKQNGVISISSAISLLNIASDSIDYMFIDPPFGANLAYSELNSIWETWMRVKTNTKTEAIVNRTQEKDLFAYQSLMNASLKEFYRILKPGKWLTMEFSNTSASVWNSIQNALQGVGFVVANVSALDKKQGSFKAVTTTTAVKQDLVITCFKPSVSITKQFESHANTHANVWDFTTELLLHLPIHTTHEYKTAVVVERSPKILYDKLIAYYVQHGYPVPLDAHDFQEGLRERYKEIDGMFFTYEQAAEYLEKKKSAPEMAPMGLIVSDEANGIQWLKNQLMKPQTYQEIQPEWMQAIGIGTVRKNDIIPELKQLLEENFIEESDGKWRLPNIQDDKDLEALRTKTLLREFKIYVEAADKPKARIKEARVEALRAGFKQCYVDKDFETIVKVGNKIPENLRDEDEVLLQFYDIALNKM